MEDHVSRAWPHEVPKLVEMTQGLLQITKSTSNALSWGAMMCLPLALPGWPLRRVVCQGCQVKGQYSTLGTNPGWSWRKFYEIRSQRNLVKLLGRWDGDLGRSHLDEWD